MADTIFAQATVPGRSGVAVVRVSGPSAFAALGLICRPLPPARRASLREIRRVATGEVLDQAVVLRFPRPGSFTGEDVVELHLHGSHAICRAVQAELAALPGLRVAAPGEFTRRALQNGRMDVAEVEGLADLIAAETEAQRRQALRLMRGELSRKVTRWRSLLIEALAMIEAEIDFADEDVPRLVSARAMAPIRGVAEGIAAELAGSHAAERVRDGFEVALVGPPNVGKSTLINAISSRDVALTSEIAGTTRDVLEVRLDLRGLAVTLLDMAGFHDTSDPLESLGVARARERAEAADLRVFLVAAAAAEDGFGVVRRDGDLVVLAKSDLGGPQTGAVSGLTGAGVPELLAQIGEELTARAAPAGMAGRARQVDAMRRALAALKASERQLGGPCPAPELAAAELYAAITALDFLVGRVDVEAVLDAIFASFCLGK